MPFDTAGAIYMSVSTRNNVRLRTIASAGDRDAPERARSQSS